MNEINKNLRIDEKSQSLAEVEITYKNKVKTSEMPEIKSSSDAFQQFLKLFDSGRIAHSEEFIILCLNRANKVMGWFRVSSGGISGTVIDIRIILQVALNTNASSLIVAHNHPSGNLKPSESDLQITRKIKDALQLFDIKLLDHLIISPDESYLSMCDEGKVFEDWDVNLEATEAYQAERMTREEKKVTKKTA